MQPERVRWVLSHRVPLGSLTITAGAPKLGKSTWTRALAAAVSRGTADGDLHGCPSHVVILSYEDHPTATIVPGLLAADADLSRVHVLSPSVIEADGGVDLVTLTTDIDRIGEECARVDARLLIVDPLMASLASSTDSHRDQDVRRALAPLSQLAEQIDLAANVVSHTTKAKDGDMIRRIGASVGLSGAARSLLVMGADPADPEGADGPGRVLVSRGNLAPPQPAFAYRIEGATVEHHGEEFETSRLVYVGESDANPDELLAPPEREERSERDDAADFLRTTLADGPRPAREVIDEADEAGICGPRTLRRAKTALGVESKREGGIAGSGRWVWSLPKAASAPTHTDDSLSDHRTREPDAAPPDLLSGPKAATGGRLGNLGRDRPSCRYPGHRESDYETPAGLVCGVCHPAPGGGS